MESRKFVLQPCEGKYNGLVSVTSNRKKFLKIENNLKYMQTECVTFNDGMYLKVQCVKSECEVYKVQS